MHFCRLKLFYFDQDFYNEMSTPEETSQKRPLSQSAPENDSKRQKDEPAPAWAQRFFADMKESLADMIDDRLGTISERVEVVNNRVETLEERVKRNEDLIAAQAETIKQLESNGARMQDDQLRNSLTICDVPRRPEEKHGEHTRLALAKALSVVAPRKNYPQWVEAIQRAHRAKKPQPGKIPVIHVKFLNWQDVNALQSIFMTGDFENPDGIHIYGKYSAHTEARRKIAVEKRKELVKAFPGCKAHLKYPAEVWMKKPHEKNYSLIEKF